MRISEHYSLGLEQPSLDFVDVRLDTDVPLFVDPTALFLLDTEWGAECRGLIHDYFSLVLENIREGRHDEAKRLLAVLNEPNETHLGLSKRKSRGHGMGKELAVKMWDELKDSLAVSTGLIKDLEDTALMIDGIGSDVISDIVTNIIREPLLKYTVDMSVQYGITLVDNVASKPIWDPLNKKWTTKHVRQPVIDDERLMLVPKSIVRKSITYDAGRYYNLYLLEQLQQEAAAEGIVQILKNGNTKPPTKKSLKEIHGEGKEQNRRLTPTREQVLERYKNEQRENPKEALNHEEISESVDTPEPNWDELLNNLLNVAPGRDDAKTFEKAVQALFEALFYPWLTYPMPQTRINGGRKIVDITFTNVAQDDFFKWLKSNYPSAFIFVECKNYSTDLGNPELDQLAGRFAPSRGQVGLLVSRKIENKELIRQSCRDTANDHRGFIIALDDDDIKELVEAVKTGRKGERLNLLRTRFNELVL
ncbi:MAG TPA: hypothetical protein VGF75_04875 [Candidatus Saccharimonadales bacterium]|jgi:hypothetical protein